jgi:alkanesulfonate monooxygenase SsuD/methylene tetrahydromethanopterin reductase-like flavin-dependent oxidoreductase (luciferase family)
MKLTLSLAGHGHHPAAWRVSALARGPSRVPRYEAIARRAEEGGIDALFVLPPAGAPDRLLSGAGDAIQLDPSPLVATLIARTSRIGLGATVYMAHTQPFHTARAFAVMDNLSEGRTAWILDTEGTDQQENDFGHAGDPGRATRFARAAEYIDVTHKLWDSWEDGAVVADKEDGLFADSTKIHPIHHAGEHFRVRGPLTAVRPIQGHPVKVMRDASDEGLRLATRFADVFLADSAEVAARLRALAGDRVPHILLNVQALLAPTAEAARDKAARLDAMAAPSGNAPRFVGTPGDFADHLAALTGCDGVNILPAVLPDDVEAIVAEVIPLLRQRGMRPEGYTAATLREHLGLPRPGNSFATAA